MDNFKLNVLCEKCGTGLKRNKSKSGMYFCNIGCKSDWQRDQKPVSKEWLYQKYIAEGLSANEIAKIVNRNQKRVYEWLVNEGIETRPRGTGWEKREGFNWFLHGKESPFKGKLHTNETRQRFHELRIKDGHVPYLVNGVHHMKSKTGPLHRNWQGGTTPLRQQVCSTVEWKSAVKEVWLRENAICQRCGLDHRTIDRKVQKFHLHHFYGFSKYPYLRTNPDNLALLCDKCHRWVHSNQNVEKEFRLKRMVIPTWLASRK